MDTATTVGIFFLIIGLVIITGVMISARVASQRRQQMIGSDDPVIPVNLASVSDGVIVSRVGGQVVFANDVTRLWFNLDGGEPDLWLLAQRVIPANAFLELFATEGQAQFTINDRKIEARSHRVAVGDVAQFIVVMREEAPLPVLDRESRGSGRAIRVLAEAVQAINASLELNTTLLATLAGARRLVDYESAQICLWDSEVELLRPAARSGSEPYVAATQAEGQTYRRGEGFPGWIALKRQPLLVVDIDEQAEPRPLLRPTDTPMLSYLGVPMTIRNRFIGTLEVFSTTVAHFDREDQALLTLIAEQAASALENARQYSEQAERVIELSGLQKIAEAISELQDPRQLFAQLGKQLAELMETELAGVLLYDREQERLVAQRPLYGVADLVASRYAITLKKGSQARVLWEDVTYWFSNDVPNDRMAEEMGLLELAELAGVKTTAMAAMIVGEEHIGVLQVSNKLDSTPFSMEDIRLLQTYADQAAIIVESARLYLQEQSRVAELEGLQQIAQAMSAFTNPEELYGQLTQRIAELMGVDICGVLIHEPDDDVLIARTPFFGVSDEVVQTYSLAVGKRGLAREVWRERDLFESNHVFTDQDVDQLGMRDFARGSGMRTALMAPLSAAGRRFGMLQVANKTDGTDFDEDDKRLAAIFAGQAATLIDNARLYQDTDTTLRKRAAELRSVSRISRELNATLELERILEVIAVEAQRAEGAQWGGLTMFDWNKDTGELRHLMQFGTTVGPEALILEKAAAQSGETLVIDDFDKVSHYPSPIAGARSALLVPIVFEGKTVGVISLYGDKPRGLGPSAAEYIQALSSQAIIAVTNATRHQEQVERSELLRRRAEQMTQIFELGRMFRSDQSVESNLSSVARAISESVDFDVALISVLDDAAKTLHHVAQYGLPEAVFKNLEGTEVDFELVKPYLIDKYRMSSSFFVPHTESAGLMKTLGLPFPPESSSEAMEGLWQPGDLLLVQLRSSGDELLGILTIDQPRTGLVPSREVIELIEIFGNQAAVVVENSRLYRSVEERAEELGRSLDNLGKSYQELDNLSQEMIRKDIELSQVNEQLNRRAQRLLALHRIMESVDTTHSPDEVLRDIARSVVKEMDVEQCLIALDSVGSDQMSLIASEGKLPDGFAFETLLGSDSPLFHCYNEQEPTLYAPGGKGGTPPAQVAEQLGANTFVALPMQVEMQKGLMLIGSTRRGSAFTEDDRDLFALLASQIIVEYENARLYQAVQDEAAAAAGERDRLQQLHLITTALQQTRDLKDRLAIIARGIRSVGWGRVAVTLHGPDSDVVEMATAGYDEAGEKKLAKELLPGTTWAHRFDDPAFGALRMGTCYYLEHDNPWVIEHVPADRGKDTQVDPGHWHPLDQVYLPMFAGSDIIGVINLRDPKDGLKPTISSMRPIELFMQQASSALDNTRLYQETLELQSFNEAIVQSIQQGIVVMDRDGRIESLNGYVREQYGWPADMVGKKLFEEQPALAALGLADDLLEVVQKAQPIERPNAQYTVGDEVRHLNLYLYPRFDEQEVLNGVVLLAEDITQRAMLEADIALRGQQLAALNEVSRRITSTLSVDDVVKNALEQADQVIRYDHVELWLKGQDEDSVQLVGTLGLGTDDDTIGLTMAIKDVALFSQIARDNQPLVVDDAPPPVADKGKKDHLRSWLGVPMVSGGSMIGITVFEKTEAHAYAPADAQVAAAFANQVAVALENARLFEEAQDRAAELHSRTQRLTLLNRISSTLGSSLDRNSILQTTVDELVGALDAPRGSVIVIEPDRKTGTLTIQSPSNPDGSVEPLTVSIEDNPAFKRLEETRVPLPIEDLDSDPLAGPLGKQLTGRSVSSTLLIPLMVGNVMIGVITIDAMGKKRHFEPEQIELAQTVTNQAAVSVQNAQLFQETVARQRELGILFEAGRIASASLDLDTVVKNAADYFVRSLEFEGCYISLLDRASGALSPLIDFTHKDGPREIEPADIRSDLQDYPNTARVIKEQDVVVVDAASRDLTAHELAWMHSKGMGTELLLPLVVREDIIGLVELWDGFTGRRVGQREIRLARALAASVATAMENARLHDETEKRLSELSIINDLSRALTQIISIEDLYQTLQDQIGQVLGVDSLSLIQRDPATGKLTFLLAARKGLRLHLDALAAGSKDPYTYVADTREPLLISRGVDHRLKELDLKHTEPRLKSFLGVPFSSGEVTGVLTVEDYAQEGTFSEATLRVLSPIAAQVAVSIENARLYSELEQRLSETTTMQEVSRVVNSALDLQEIFERVVRELASAFKYPLISLFTLDDREMVMQASHGYTTREIERFRRISIDAGITGRAARSGEPQLVPDVSDDPDYMAAKEWVRSEVAVPIISDEKVLGVLGVASGADNLLDDSDLQLMRTFAGQVATAMTNARLYAQMVTLSEELEQRVEERTRELREERDRIDTLYRIAVELTASLDLDRVLNRALELVGEAVGADSGTLFLVDPQSDLLIHRASMRYDESLPPGGRQVQIRRHEGLAGWIMDNRESLVIDNVQVDPRWAQIPGTEARRSLLGAPLMSNQEVLGCIFFNSDTESAFNAEHLKLVEAAANQVAASINNAELYRLIRDQAERLGVMLRSQTTEAAKSQAILESVADGVMVADQSGEIILFNAAAERVLGLRRDKALGRPAQEMTGLYGPGAENWVETIDLWRASPHDYRGQFLSEQLELEDRVVSVHVSPVLHGDEYLGLVSVFRDITREVIADRIKSEFVARVSHELRTPMTSIKGYADLLLLGAAGEITDQQRKFLETVKSNADRLSLLVNDLLDISLIEQGQLELDIREIDLRDLIRQVLDAFEGRKKSEGREMVIEASLPDDLQPIEGDYDRVTQIITNLTANAYQYTPDEGTVTIRVRPDTEGVSIDVADTGIGIPKEDQERIFERFFRGELNPLVFKSAGTGLGLAIVQQLAVMHSGEVTFESEEGVGTTFSVWLPYRHVKVEQ